MIIYSVNLLAIIFVHTDVESIEKLNHHEGRKETSYRGYSLEDRDTGLFISEQ